MGSFRRIESGAFVVHFCNMIPIIYTPCFIKGIFYPQSLMLVGSPGIWRIDGFIAFTVCGWFGFPISWDFLHARWYTRGFHQRPGWPRVGFLVAFVLFSSTRKQLITYFGSIGVLSSVGNFLRMNVQGCFKIGLVGGLHYLVIATHRFLLCLQWFSTAWGFLPYLFFGN